MNKKILWVIGIVVVVVIVVASIRGANNNTDTIKIGFIGPLTGDAALYGEPAKNIIQMAIDEINEKGGINGQQIQFIPEDGKCNGKDAVSAAQKLINIDKVQVILGGFCSSESMAIVPVATDAKVTLFSYASSNPSLTGISPFFVRDYPSDSSQGEVLARIAYNDKRWRKVAFIQEQTDYSAGIFKAFSDRFQKDGGVVIKEEYSSNTNDFRSILAKLRDSNSDALFIDPQTPASAVRIITQMSQMNWKPALIANDILSDPNVFPENFSFFNGAIGAKFDASLTSSKSLSFIDAYKKKYGSEPPYLSYAETEYDSVYIVKDAILNVGNNGENIANWLRTSVVDWEGASGKITILSNGDRDGGHTPFVIKDATISPYIK
ncbi:MAG: ABC transporter substrate-binding protein [Candidatus Paceibacterota bacterium]